MADRKLSILTELATTPANDDEVYIRDVSEPAADESKRITMLNLIALAKAIKLDDFATPDDNTDLDALTTKHGLFAKLLWDKLNGIEAGAKDDLTGAEIVTLLEALAGGSQLSHDQLDDVSTSDHHTKYTDANARAAAVEDAAYGAGWNGDTTHAPSQNAVYDKIETLGGAILTVAETEVFNGTTSTSWADLDLSGTIGNQATLVLLKIKGASFNAIGVRKNGDTDEFMLNAAQAGGAAFGDASSSNRVVLVVATDGIGKIEWKTTQVYTATVDIIAYIK